VTDVLDVDRIAEGLGQPQRSLLGGLTVLPEVDSTNSELLRIPVENQHAHAVIAERQLAGRGRRQRRWHSPAGGNLYFSLGWRFVSPNVALSALPLVAALAVAHTLSDAGLAGHGVKWPNDILVGGRKVCGILAEMKWTGSEALAVVGIGINVRMPRSKSEDPDCLIDRPWTDLESHLGAERRPCDRNRLATMLLNRLLDFLPRFEQEGFAGFEADWRRWDLLRDGAVTLETDDGPVSGTAVGVNENGELLLEAHGEVRGYAAGEVRVFSGVRAF
jgi:BirA family biotin operon repressor/biotin-[acetyl-CoA-carboxylase] ligase